MSTYSLTDVLDDISLNFSNLINDFNVSDVSNQILDLSTNINNLNIKIDSVLEIYTIINDLKVRFAS
jgi:hypothetical protein